MAKNCMTRSQHYVFVHRALRDAFFHSPDKIMAILMDESRNDSLLVLWNNAGDMVGEAGLVAPVGLCCEVTVHSGTTIAIIKLPTPRVVPEAYFVALVYRPSAFGQKKIARYLTLEHNYDIAFLCEWVAPGEHANMGPLCNPIIEEFRNAVLCVLTQDHQQVEWSQHLEAPHATKLSETQIGTMKKPVLEDFGLTEQQYNEAKERVDHCEDVVPFIFLSMFVSPFMGIATIFLIVKLKLIGEPNRGDGGYALLLVFGILWFFILLMIVFKLADIRESRVRSKPIYRKIELYEAALERYKQTSEQHWKSLKGIALETALGNLYRKMGYRVRQTKGSGDEGIDLILEKEGAKTVVQCKGHVNPVGVGAVRDLYGAMMHFGAPSAILACPAGFTEGVVQFVRGKPIGLVSVTELIEMAERIQQPTSEALGRDKLNLGGREGKQQPIHEVIETGKMNFDEKSRRIKEGLEGLCKKYKCTIHNSVLALDHHMPKRRYFVSYPTHDASFENNTVEVYEERIDIFVDPYHIKRFNECNCLDEIEQVENALKEVKSILESRSKK